MKKKSLLIVVIIIILLGLAGSMLFFKNQSSSSIQSTDTKQTNATTTLLNLLGMGKNLSCTFSTDNEQGQTSGTVYIAGEHMRGDFTTNNPKSGTLTSTMIREGDWMYSWTSSSNQGVKMKFSEIDADTNANTGTTNQEAKANQYVDPNEQVDYDCKPWTVDRAIFTPPADITFTDFSSQMMEVQEKSEEFRNSQCAACDSLEGETKAACLKTLDCQ